MGRITLDEAEERAVEALEQKKGFGRGWRYSISSSQLARVAGVVVYRIRVRVWRWSFFGGSQEYEFEVDVDSTDGEVVGIRRANLYEEDEEDDEDEDDEE